MVNVTAIRSINNTNSMYWVHVKSIHSREHKSQLLSSISISEEIRIEGSRHFLQSEMQVKLV